MGLFGKGKKDSATEEAGIRAPVVVSPAGKNHEQDPGQIRVFDEFGRELFITKEKWRTDVLPGSLKSNWNNPDQLYGIIAGSLHDGFFDDILGAAEHLSLIDPIPARGACVYGIALMKTGRMDQAERVFQSYLDKHGEDGTVLTNLAKVLSARNEHEGAIKTLWRALEVDPNQENGLNWYIAIQRERAGEGAAFEALRHVADIPASWRAQLLLARGALNERNLETALVLYRETVARITGDMPTDALIQMSGDLGNAGYLTELLELIEPLFVASIHGIQVGNNLIKAHLDLGQIEAAKSLLDRLYGLNRPDFRPTLSFWDTAIAKARIARDPAQSGGHRNVQMACIRGPVWLPALPPAQLFPARQPECPVVLFLGSTAETPNPPEQPRFQLTDPPGRFSRALPLFLAEHIWFNTGAETRTLVPLTTGSAVSFVVSGVSWKDEDAAQYSRQSAPTGAFIVTTHLKCTTEPWIAELRLIRSDVHECVGEVSAVFDPSRPYAGATELARKLSLLLAMPAQLTALKPPLWYSVPAEPNFNMYLRRLEQLLAVRCAGMEDPGPMRLNNEREIIDGNLQLCVACPENICARILLAQTVRAMKRIRPDVVTEFIDRISLLQAKKPLGEAPHELVQSLLDETLKH